MNYKKIVLALLSCFIVLIFFNVEIYKTWVNDRILVFYKSEIYDQTDIMELEERRRNRWSNTYTDALNIKKYLDTSGIKDPLLIMPPPEYVKKNFPKALIPEPIVFYYFAGVKTTWPESKFAEKANVAMFLSAETMAIKKIENKEQLEEVRKFYKQ